MSKALEMAFRHFAVFVLGILAKLKFRPSRNVINRPEPGSVIICNHTSVWDFSLLLYAMFPWANLRFVATGVQFDKSRFVAWIFRRLGMIRKNQGSRDIKSVREMMKASQEGGIVVVYAAGMTSYDGREAWDALPGTGTLPKLLKTSVYTAVVNGGFISHPRYLGSAQRGRTEITVKRLYTAEQVSSLSAQQLQEGINAALRFNDWDWQEKRRARFSGMKNMKNVSRILYMCPECGSEGQMKEGKASLTCSVCGFSARRDKYGFFAPSSPKGFTRMDKWADMEIEKLAGEIEKPDFELSAEATLYTYPQKTGGEYMLVGEGTLTFRRDGLRFTGGAKETFIPMGAFQFFILNDIDVMYVNTEETSFRFVFKDVRLMTKWFFAHRLMVKQGAA